MGVVLVNDTTAPRSAPPLSAEALTYLGERIRLTVAQSIPINLGKVIVSRDLAPDREVGQVVRLAKEQGMDYVLLAIVSSTEAQTPASLDFVTSSSTLEGVNAKNFALVELALVDAKTGAVLVRGEGRAWASLDRPVVAMRSSEYPVIKRSMVEGPIYPQGQNPEDALRTVSAEDALTQAVMHFSQRWGQT